jgi:hypothetical protein
VAGDVPGSAAGWGLSDTVNLTSAKDEVQRVADAGDNSDATSLIST